MIRMIRVVIVSMYEKGNRKIALGIRRNTNTQPVARVASVSFPVGDT